jgi:chromosomal replication initiation ATPase DnaA
VLSQFSEVKGRAIRAFVRFVKSQMTVGHREDLYQVRDQRFLGDEAFVDRVVRERKNGLFYVYDISIQELVAHVSSFLGISVEKVCSMTRNREGALGRAIVGYVGKKLCSYSNKSIAEYFYRDPVVVSRGIAKVERRAGSDKDFEARLRRLERVIALGQKRKIRT